MRVLLADGDQDVRGALRLLLMQDLGMHVIGEAADLTELRAWARDAGPGLLLLDWALLGAQPGDAMAQLRSLAPGLCIVVLSAHPETRAHAFAAGADAFVSKADAPAQLVTTLRALHAANTPCGSAGDVAGDTIAPEQGQGDV